MKALANLPASDREKGLLTVVVEAVRGSRTKAIYDETLGVFRLSKLLPAGFPGCVAAALLVGVIEIEHFFVAFNEGRTVEIIGRRDAERALELVLAGMRHFEEPRGVRARAG